MTARQVGLAALVLPVVLLAVAACTDGNDPAAATATTDAATTGTGTTGAAPADRGTAAPAVTAAGSSEAALLAQLPSGTATGTAVLQYDGIGELSEPFRGTCSSAAGRTTIAGTADTAQIRLEAGADGLLVSIDDIGLSATSQLDAGRYQVSDGHLSLAAPLSSDGEAVGSAELEIDCGG